MAFSQKKLKKYKFPPSDRGQATATSRACYVCSKPTTVCLATTNAIDFLYTCEAHLSDTGFATELVDPGAAAVKETVSKEEIARIKAEWEAKEALKKAKNKGKDKDKDKDSKAKSGEKGAGGEAEMEENGKKDAKSPSPPGTFAGSGSSAATPTHKRYSLHRDFFAMRQAEHRSKKQTKQTQELAPRLPGAPRGSLMG